MPDGRIPLTNVESKPDEVPGKDSNPSRSDETDIPLPYTDSEDFLTSYFGLGTEWKDYDASFSEEIDTIDKYIQNQIDAGIINNSQSAAKTLLKSMEKINNLKNEERSVVRLEVLANYAEFLNKNNKLKSNLKRYG